MKATILYAIGIAALGFGFYEFWHGDRFNQHAFTIGSMCVVAAAALQVVRDLRSRLRGRLRRRR